MPICRAFSNGRETDDNASDFFRKAGPQRGWRLGLLTSIIAGALPVAAGLAAEPATPHLRCTNGAAAPTGRSWSISITAWSIRPAGEDHRQMDQLARPEAGDFRARTRDGEAAIPQRLEHRRLFPLLHMPAGDRAARRQARADWKKIDA